MYLHVCVQYTSLGEVCVTGYVWNGVTPCYSYNVSLLKRQAASNTLITYCIVLNIH